MTEDQKILAAVSGVVVLGAVALAVAGWMSLEPGEQPITVTAAARPAIEATPASYESATPLGRLPVSELGAPEIEAAPEVEPAFTVQPGENFIARGIETFEAREFDHAVAYFRAEVEERPERAWTQYMLGLSLWKAGRLDEASIEMTRAAELDGESIKTFVNLSRIENDRGQYDAALEAAQSAVGLEPENAAALFLEGRSLRNLDRRDEALESLERSVEIDGENGYAQNLLGLTLLESGRTVEAVEVLENAVVLESEVAFIHNNLGMALEHEGRRDEAMVAYGRAVALDPRHERAAANVARLEPLVSETVEVQIAVAEEPTEETEVAEADVDGPSNVGGDGRP
jgi:tetratricopeptide (TPR) repeat protein